MSPVEPPYPHIPVEVSIPPVPSWRPPATVITPEEDS